MIHYDKILKTLKIQCTSQDLSNYADYINFINKVTHEVEKLQPENIVSIIQSTTKNYDQEMEEWLVKCILPVFKKNKVKKLAFVLGETLNNYIKPQFTESLPFDFQLLKEEKTAIEWIQNKH